MTLNTPDQGHATPDEAALVAKLKNQEPIACEALVRLYGGAVLAIARRMLRSDKEAREVTQATFVRAFQGVDGFPEGMRLWPWIRRIAVSTALGRLRPPVHRQPSIDSLLPAFQPDGHHVSSFVEWRCGDDLAPEKEPIRRMVRHCIDQLPEPYRTVLLLRDVEKLETAETADALGVNAATVQLQLHQARQALRTLLDRSFRGGAS